MKKIITLMLLLVITTSCYNYYPYSYGYQGGVKKPAAVTPVHQFTEQRVVLVSYDGGKTYIEKTVTIVTENTQQQERVRQYWRQHPTPQWIASPTRAWLDTGGLFGQYLFQDIGIRFLIDASRITLCSRR